MFDAATDYPGITMIEVMKAAGRITGQVTSKWYEPRAVRSLRRARNHDSAALDTLDMAA